MKNIEIENIRWEKYSMYCFLTKNGQLRKNYIKAINYILTATMQYRQLIKGRYEEVVDEYDCYTTKIIDFSSRDKSNMEEKVVNICNEFQIKIHRWYSGNLGLQIEFHGDNVEFMLNELKKI